MWEASDHIDALKEVLKPHDSGGHRVPAPEVCRIHARALIWLIRHVDLESKKTSSARGG